MHLNTTSKNKGELETCYKLFPKLEIQFQVGLIIFIAKTLFFKYSENYILKK